MSSTHLSLHYHIVFSTKERRASIESEWCERLHAFLGGAVRTLGGVPVAVGGTNDHVHLLIGLRATHCLADVVKDVKTSSSRWVHVELQKSLFAWQTGYGAFTVSARQIERVRNYVLNQEEHHRQKRFQDEYLDLLQKAGVEYDERYLW